MVNNIRTFFDLYIENNEKNNEYEEALKMTGNKETWLESLSNRSLGMRELFAKNGVNICMTF